MEKKRILIVTQYFYPENFRSSDLAFEMAKRGHDVTALVGIPNYPQGKYYKGYGIFKRRKEIIKGVNIYRVFQTPRGRSGKSIALMLNYATYALFATLNILVLCIIKKFDVILVHETSPITQGIPAIVAKKVYKIPVLFWVLDLWPESLSAVNAVKNKVLLNCVDCLVKWIYRNSKRILISSKSFKKSICEKGDFKSKIHYFPNWVEDDLINGTKYDVPDFGNKFVVMFAGNIGEAQDLESIVSAAEYIKEKDNIRFVIVGDGRNRIWAENEVKRKNLNNVFFVGSYPKEAMKSMFSQADVMLVTLKDDSIFNMTVPAKVQAYMAMRKPILGMINGETANLIREADCGYCVNASNYVAFAVAIEKLSKLSSEELLQKGKNGYNYYNNFFAKSLCMDNFEKILNE